MASMSARRFASSTVATTAAGLLKNTPSKAERLRDQLPRLHADSRQCPDDARVGMLQCRPHSAHSVRLCFGHRPRVLGLAGHQRLRRSSSSMSVPNRPRTGDVGSTFESWSVCILIAIAGRQTGPASSPCLPRAGKRRAATSALLLSRRRQSQRPFVFHAGGRTERSSLRHSIAPTVRVLTAL